MRYIFILLIACFLANAVTAQQERLVVHSYSKNPGNIKKGKYTMNQFIGRWQETARMSSKTKELAALSDTFYIHFYDNGKADTKQGNSVVITGTSELFVDDYITTSANDFKIISATPATIVLDDMSGYLHNMSRVKQFAYEVSVSPPVAVEDTSKAMIDLSATSLIKDWFAYRRAAGPGVINSATALIRNLRIKGKTSDNNFKGEIEYARFGKAIIEPCKLIVTGNMLSIVADGNTWNIEVYKADGKEMILGKTGDLVYYFKNGN